MTDFEIVAMEDPESCRNLPRMRFEPVTDRARTFVAKHGAVEGMRWMTQWYQGQVVSLLDLGYSMRLREAIQA